MNRRYDHASMDWLYGICHYIIIGFYDAAFRGEVVGLEHIPKKGPFLIAGNHASHLDPPAIGSQIPRQLAFFARKSLWKPGFATWWMDGVGSIPVDRDGSDLAAIKRVLQTLKTGKALILFPEGTRSPDGTLQPPKAGVGMIASKTQVPVLPVRIFNSHIAFGRDGKLRIGTSISITFGPLLYPADYDFPGGGKDRYQRTSEKIMAAIAVLREPPVTIV